jgi:ABC-2 type transport system ATP-binding protein
VVITWTNRLPSATLRRWQHIRFNLSSLEHVSLIASGVSFAYRKWRGSEVFSSFNWTVQPGQTTLLLGPNGAGKSTLLKLLSGYDRPRRGTISLDGDKSRAALFSHVGWMPQTVRPARGLTALEQLEYAAWVAGLDRAEARTIAAESLELVKLSGKAKTRATDLSGGQLRRLGLAQALLRRAPVLLLDEPTAGLDPAQALNFRHLLNGLDCPGGIVVSTHQVGDLADDVDRVAVLADGTIRFDGTVDEFLEYGNASGVASGSLADIFSHMVDGGLH